MSAHLVQPFGHIIYMSEELYYMVYIVYILQLDKSLKSNRPCTRAAVVHLNFRAGSTFPVLICTVPSSMDRTSRSNKVDVVRLYASYRLNLLLPKGQISVCSISVNEGPLSRTIQYL